MLFSQRIGIKPVNKTMQVDSMSSDLRNSLWNALTISYWETMRATFTSRDSKIDTLVRRLWVHYFKEPVDTHKGIWQLAYQAIRDYFFGCEWFEVYDFMEFVALNYPDASVNHKFIQRCNSVLEQELSAHRFVAGKIAQITSETEIAEIEDALHTGELPSAVKTHLKAALSLLADRKSPDYRNSIKESISAVEAMCRLITGNVRATLGEALKEIEKNVGLHPALKAAFSKLYGWTNDAEGIRHALLDESNLSFEDAKFMLVSCSAFTNYLNSKSSKAGIKL